MSVEEDIELKDLLMQTLTENGCLAKIKAQLRASVFLALEEENSLNSKKPLLNEKVKSCLNTTEGQLMFCVVKEFLEYFNLKSTLEVFNAESYSEKDYHYKDRSTILKDLGLDDNDETVPLLQKIMHIAQRKNRILEVDLNINKKEIVSIDNKTSNSENSIKTDSNMIEDLSDSNNSSCSSTSTKDNGLFMEEENLEVNDVDIDLNLNRTFITEPNKSPKYDESLMNSNINLTYDVHDDTNSSPHITLPNSISEKIDEITAPVLKLSPERVKSPPKVEKFKSKNNLNSLSDLPPLNISRSGTILPSLYTKEFREKSNSYIFWILNPSLLYFLCKCSEKMFFMAANYYFSLSINGILALIKVQEYINFLSREI